MGGAIYYELALAQLILEKLNYYRGGIESAERKGDVLFQVVWPIF